jgi:hypothetical protein
MARGFFVNKLFGSDTMVYTYLGEEKNSALIVKINLIRFQTLRTHWGKLQNTNCSLPTCKIDDLRGIDVTINS